MRDTTRSGILRRFRRLRDEIKQMFVDADSWNDNARKLGDPLIDPDPFGEMRRLADAIDELLANDPGHGPIAPLDFQRSN